MSNYQSIFGSAEWIAATDPHAFPLIRRRFTLSRLPASAELRIVGFGGFTAEINGASVTDALFLPLNTDFEERDFPHGEETAHRILCESVPVASLLREGENEITVRLYTTLHNIIGPFHRPLGNIGNTFGGGYRNPDAA